MDYLRNISQQAPWRTQQQLFGFVLVVLVFVAMVAGLYLSVTSKAAVLGREIQDLQDSMTENKQTNAGLSNQLGDLLSYNQMQRRAEAMGFEITSADAIEYVTIPGYTPLQPVNLSENRPGSEPHFQLPAEYTQSLWEWFETELVTTAYASGGSQ